MKLAIVGSRKFNDYNKMCDFVLSKFKLEDIEVVVSGGAKGADSLAEKFANDNNIPISIKAADWKKYGKAAGPIRNKLIIEEADAVVAFPASDSKGTLHDIKLAQQMGKRLEVLNV